MTPAHAMTPDDLKTAGEALFGRWGWQTKLARQLKVDGSTVRRWLSGASQIPGPAEVAIELLLAQIPETKTMRTTEFDKDSPLDPAVVAEIQRRLDVLEDEQGLRILLAVESGSRAWGFPSPDSDYDVRFLYLRERDWYLAIEARRDVIELPIEGLYDINGWDLKKALHLLIKPNPVLHEWLESPLVYRQDPLAVAKLRNLADRTRHQRPGTHHYLSLGDGQYERFIAGKDCVALKKYFYALRPALALRWLRLNPDQRPPMNVAALRAGIALPAEIESFLDELIARKAVSKELGEGPRIALLDAFLEEEFARAREANPPKTRPDAQLLAEANALFLELVS